MTGETRSSQVQVQVQDVRFVVFILEPGCRLAGATKVKHPSTRRWADRFSSTRGRLGIIVRVAGIVALALIEVCSELPIQGDAKQRRDGRESASGS